MPCLERNTKGKPNSGLNPPAFLGGRLWLARTVASHQLYGARLSSAKKGCGGIVWAAG